jgi:RNA polymerase sigma-70 factor (ECF subfamily)
VLAVPQTSDFQALMRRVRAGDAEAAAELVRQYEPELRRSIRVKLGTSRLRHLLDSVDVCQSVLLNFFLRSAAGQFDLDSPDQLLGLLLRMARNKLLDHYRHEAGRHGQRRQPEGEEALAGVAEAGPTPSVAVAQRDLLCAFRARLNEEERFLADQRGLGLGWAEIAALLGKETDAVRKQLRRAIDRVAAELGLDGVDHD